MKIAIIANLREGKGLAVDARILTALLESWHHEVTAFDFRSVERNSGRFHAVIHLEMIVPKALYWSEVHLWFCNPDWAKKEYLDYADAMRVVLAKSKDGFARLHFRDIKRVEYVGFESEDVSFFHHAGIESDPMRLAKERRFFHTWAGSLMKGTGSVTRAWGLGNHEPYPASFYIGSKEKEDAFRLAQNKCLFWLQPSNVEGYGHVIHEGLSVGALVATCDAAPMNESQGIAFKIPCKRVARQCLADVYECKPSDVAETCDKMWALTEWETKLLSSRARAHYEMDRTSFRLRFKRVLEGL